MSKPKQATSYKLQATSYKLLALCSLVFLTALAACPMEPIDMGGPAPNGNDAPSIANQAVSVGENQSSSNSFYTVQANDSDGDTLVYSITTNSPATGTGLFVIEANTGSLRLAEGQSLDFESPPNEHRITVQVSDGTATASATVTITVTDAPDNAPEISNQAAVSVEQGTAITPIRFTSSLGTIVSCSASQNLPSGLSTSLVNEACEIRGTVPLTETPGVTTVTVTATNNDGDNSATVDITVSPVAPGIIDLDAVQIERGSVISPISFSNTGGTIETCTPTGLPMGLNALRSNGTCVISGTVSATVAQGEYSVQISAENTAGASVGTIVMNVYLTSAPGDISNLEVSASNETSITFSWDNPTASLNESFAGVHVEVMNASDAAPATCTTATAPSSGAGGTSHTISGLTAGANYSIRVCSINAEPTPQVTAGSTLTGRAIILGCPGLVGSLTMAEVTSSGAQAGMHPVRIIDGTSGTGASYTTNLNPTTSNLNENNTADYAFMFCGVPRNSINRINTSISALSTDSDFGALSVITHYDGIIVNELLNLPVELTDSVVLNTIPTASSANLGVILIPGVRGASDTNYWGQFAADGTTTAVFPASNSQASTLQPADIMLTLTLANQQ